MLPARNLSIWCGRSLLAGLTLVGACSSGPAEKQAPVDQAAPLPAAPSPASVTEALVADATISGLFATPARFEAGSHEGAPFTPGGAARPLAVMMAPLVRLGELDAVPGTDAAVVIASNEGGSGERIKLAIVAMRSGAATGVGTATVGDRTKVRDVRVAAPDITLDVVEIGPGEPACCGTQLATKTYRLEGSTLKEQSSQVTGKLSLTGTVARHTWTAVAMDGAPIATGVTAPTLTFADDSISGTSACNEYIGPIAEPEPGTVRIGPIAGTRRACDGPAGDVEAKFLKILGAGNRYTFLAGRLVISGLDGEQMRSVTFSR
jgi:heat shock protein HslJ